MINPDTARLLGQACEYHWKCLWAGVTVLVAHQFSVDLAIKASELCISELGVVWGTNPRSRRAHEMSGTVPAEPFSTIHLFQAVTCYHAHI